MNLSYDWKLQKLKQVIEAYIAEDTQLNAREVSIALQAMSELNKMQGHYLAEKNIHINVKADSDLKQIEHLINQHAKDY